MRNSGILGGKLISDVAHPCISRQPTPRDIAPGNAGYPAMYQDIPAGHCTAHKFRQVQCIALLKTHTGSRCNALHIAVKYRVHCNSVQFSRVQVKYSFSAVTPETHSAVHSTVPTLELYLGILTLYCTSVLYPGFVPWYCGECIGVPTLVLAPISQAVSLAPDDMTSHPIHYCYRVVLQYTSSG